jgi:transcriptional regulator with XRE-family HTH domain
MNTIVGRNLKLLREANKFSQEQVSAFLNIGRSAYSMYELGEREMPLTTLEKASNLFGCDLNLFFEENKSIVDESLLCAFRANELEDSDLPIIANFREIVKSYLKMNRLLQNG